MNECEILEEFEMIADFNTWLKNLPILKRYNRILYYDKFGFKIGYFKLKTND